MDCVNDSGFSPAWLTWKIQPPAWTMTVVAKGTFDLATGAPVEPLPVEGDLLEGEDLRYAHDFAPIKPKVDLLLVGTGRAPTGVDASGVTFVVGGWSKRLAVLAKEPVPLTWTNAKKGLLVRRENTEDAACAETVIVAVPSSPSSRRSWNSLVLSSISSE